MERNEQIYLVTTEGDCEGRTTRHLGYVTGDRRDIETFFADKKVYDIRIERITIKHISKEDAQQKRDLILKKAELERELKQIEERLK